MEGMLEILKEELTKHYSKWVGVPVNEVVWAESFFKRLSSVIKATLYKPDSKGKVISTPVVSYQTLERIFNDKYELTGHANKLNTLNTLALYLNYKNWGDFCESHSLKNELLGHLRQALFEHILDEFGYFNSLPLFDYSLSLEEGENNKIIDDILAFFKLEPILRSLFDLIIKVEAKKGITTRGVKNREAQYNTNITTFRPKILYYNVEDGNARVIIEQLITIDLCLHCKFEGDFKMKTKCILNTHLHAVHVGNTPLHWKFVEMPQIGKSFGLGDNNLDKVPDLYEWNEKYEGSGVEIMGPWPSINAQLEPGVVAKLFEIEIDNLVNPPWRNYSFAWSADR